MSGAGPSPRALAMGQVLRPSERPERCGACNRRVREHGRLEDGPYFCVCEYDQLPEWLQKELDHERHARQTLMLSLTNLTAHLAGTEDGIHAYQTSHGDYAWRPCPGPGECEVAELAEKAEALFRALVADEHDGPDILEGFEIRVD